jgi:Uma2 family endonuclease
MPASPPRFPPTRLYTVDDVRAIPDDFNRYEVIDGELFVTPAPGTQHQRILARLFLLLGNHVRQHHLGEILFAPTDVVFGAMTMVEPDILFLATDALDRVTERDIQGAPTLAVEVLSPSTKRTDRGRKRALYQSQGVSEYWVVDPQLRQIEVWRPDAREAEVCTERIVWRSSPAGPALTINLVELFQAG